MTKRVLLVDDDIQVREALGQMLELADLEPFLAGSFVAAKDLITREFDGVIVTDIRMPGRDGFYLLDYARAADPELPVILLTGEGDIPMAVKAMDAGAHSFLEKPCAPSDLLATVRKALGLRAEILDSRRQRLQLESGDAASRMLHGTSPLAADLRERVRAVARAGAEVLILGEPGSGTPKIAEVIHLLSAAARHPFVKRSATGLDVASLSEAFASAGAGTLYIDEIGQLGGPAQFALLDRLEAGGGARIIAGSTHDLGAEVETGRFSADLFYRLDLMRVRIPAIRERTEDIPVLFRHYVAQACEQANLPIPDITPDHIARLMAQDWPGNARALMNAAMRFVMGLGDIEVADGIGLAEQMAKVERQLLIEALGKAGGNATAAALGLKLPRKTFYDKLARHGIRPEDYRR
ncbi:MAG: sigma-54-dependent Fis family transcriptional regulator [Rhodobacteraceae bacterium]|jgi:two-component system C4-dicarboxylate transport response regulator DctD|nr:sigma-54-dependent Fis family transcriptional regulator [Paracoccaceae bacterium]